MYRQHLEQGRRPVDEAFTGSELGWPTEGNMMVNEMVQAFGMCVRE